MSGVRLEPNNVPVVVTTNADGNVVLTPDRSSVEIIADAKQVCVDSDGETTVEVSPIVQNVEVSAAREPTAPVQVEVPGPGTVTVAGLVGIQGPPGPSSTVTFVTPDEFEQDPEYAYFGWPVWPNPGDGWRILRVSVGTNPQRRKATFENNPGYADFASAWPDRQNLTYEPG